MNAKKNGINQPNTKKKINSRQKGARFERQVLTRLAERTGERGRRTSDGYNQAARGDLEHPALAAYNVECKHREKVAINDWIDQSEADATADREPIVIWRTNKRGPYVNLRFDHFLDLVLGEADES